MLTIRICNMALLAALLAFASGARAADVSSAVPQTWQMLDYLATDYAGAVADGAVTSAPEYAEMQEFAGTARRHIADLPPVPATSALLASADELRRLVEAKAATAAVAQQAHALADALLQAYPIPTAPAQPPDLAHAASLYDAQCASCHGASGRGDGIAGAKLSPPPVDFTDQARADERSALSLYQVITQGVPGTAMPSYATQLSEADRWALAYYAGTLAYTTEATAGAQALAAGGAAASLVSGLGDLSRARAAQLAPALGLDRARAVLGYLRAHPARAVTERPEGLALARGRVAASLEAYRNGSAGEAAQLALSAYLDGVEPVEPQLDLRDAPLRQRLETAMGAYRSALSARAPIATLAPQADAIDGLLVQAQEAVEGSARDASTLFVGAFTILLREGLEALLVVVALLAFLRKSERPGLTRPVHAGWILALVAGGITWAIARYAVSISGAGRELTEGLSSLFAAAVLLSVGLWMHNKSIGGRWQAYLKQKMSRALERRSAWFLFALAFVSVYREVFETILFYAALWGEGRQGWLLAGIGSGAVVLAVLAWALLRTSRRLPIGTFFSASSLLIAVLAVVLTGKGVAALQEAGWIGVTVAPLPSIGLIGLSPSWQVLLAQVAMLVLLLAGFAWNRRGARLPTARMATATAGPAPVASRRE
jgi:high-affinity iron transporter